MKDFSEMAKLVAQDRPKVGKLRNPNNGGSADPNSLIALLTESTDKIHDYALEQMKTAKRQIEEAASEALSKIDDLTAIIGARRETTHAQFREYIGTVTSACEATDSLLLAVRENSNRVLANANATGAAIMSMPAPEQPESQKTQSPIASDHEAVS